MQLSGARGPLRGSIGSARRISACGLDAGAGAGAIAARRSPDGFHHHQAADDLCSQFSYLLVWTSTGLARSAGVSASACSLTRILLVGTALVVLATLDPVVGTCCSRIPSVREAASVREVLAEPLGRAWLDRPAYDDRNLLIAAMVMAWRNRAAAADSLEFWLTLSVSTRHHNDHDSAGSGPSRSHYSAAGNLLTGLAAGGMVVEVGSSRRCSRWELWCCCGPGSLRSA